MASQGPGDEGKKQGGFSGAFKSLGFASRLTGTGSSPRAMNVRTSNPTDIKTQLQPQDSIPEMVSSPTDVGIYDGGHQGEKMTWKRFFEDGKMRRASQDLGNSTMSSGADAADKKS
mmetsp:Transcript_10704/g.29711  ORF Transcript_10704/g.29711 Transcript_10704/m.29711 type:complete len:116 (+) Transcript_10704:2282-2629(+)